MYLLIYLLNEGKIPSLDKALKNSHRVAAASKEPLKLVHQIKLAYPLSQMCTGRAKTLEPVCQYIQSLDFDAKPSYKSIRKAFQELYNGTQIMHR